MDSKTFRANSVYVARMREIFEDPVVANALVALENEMPQRDALDDADSIVSVRLLSRQFQHKQTILWLLGLAQPLLPETPEEDPNYGVDLSAFQKPINQ